MASRPIGRLLATDADRVDTDSAVISYNYWHRRFGGRTDILGKTLTVRSTPVTIIGVAPSGFVGETSSQQPDLWLPLRLQPRVLPGRNLLRDTPPDKSMWLHVFGRLKPGATPARVEAEANAVLQSGLEAFYGSAASGERRREFLDQHLQVRSAARGASSRRVEFADSLTALMAAVGVLLLIACANLANLLLARGAARRAEMSVRLSLGAGRGRLMRQLVTESLALAALGGIAAVAVSYILHQALVGMLAESDSSFRLGFSVDLLVSAFLFTVTLVAGLLFGLLPAWQATRTDAGATLKEQWRGAIGSRVQLRSSGALVGLQLALSLPLLVGAGLLARSAYNVQRVELGFAAERLLLVRVDLRAVVPDPARRYQLSEVILEQIRRVPGVTAASFSHLGIFSGGFSTRDVEVEGHVPAGDKDRVSTFDAVGPRYFSTLGAPITLGRDISEGDRTGAPRVAVINEAFAERFFARRNPLGMRITAIEGDAARTAYRVVGVARNTRTDDVRGEIEPRFFVPTGQLPSASGSPTFLIRSQAEPSSIVAELRDAIERAGSGLPVTSVRTVEDRMAPLTAQDRTTAQLALAFAAVAMTLAAIGLYGVLSYGVARRTSEIAIRIALGAQPRRVITMILGETTLVVAAGIAVGVGLAYAASRLVDSRLYGVAPRDPVTFALATSLLLVVALVAAYLPARRASRLQPTAALRGD